MTREEAIKVLNGIRHLNYKNFWDEECDEAIDIAIKALSEDKTDRMTREEAIADIKNNIKPVVGGKSLDMAIEALSVANIKEEFESADEVKEEYINTVGAILAVISAPSCLKEVNDLIEPLRVVRCKDCRHRDLFSCPLADNDFQKDDDFCSWGERREE